MTTHATIQRCAGMILAGVLLALLMVGVFFALFIVSTSPVYAMRPTCS